MEWQREGWHKLLLEGVFILVGLSGGWYVMEAEEPTLVLQRNTESTLAKQETVEIIGLKSAAAGKKLRNPFSLVHEQEGEAAVDLPAQGSYGSSEVSNSVVHKGEKKQKNADSGGQEIFLCGIVEGGGKRLALLRIGTNTLTAGQGEKAEDWQVLTIGTSVVTVERFGQVRSLSLVMDDKTGAK